MRNTIRQTILDAAVATDTGKSILVEDYRHLGIVVIGDASADFTVKCQLSFSETAPDFSSVASITNQWDYADMADLQDGSSIDGDTGVVMSGDDVRQFEVETNGARWLCFTVTTFTDGTATVKLLGVNN